MSLPVQNLDDRKFQDLVDEAKRLIPTYCPEWTNHNVSDPGVALIELFAWMTEYTLFQLNQVPDVVSTHLLNLVGFEPFAVSAARADLTFWLVAPSAQPVVVPAGTQVASAGEAGETRVFATLNDLVISQPRLQAALTSSGLDAYVDVWESLRLDTEAVVCFPRSPLTPGDAFCLGFERSLAGNAIRLDLVANVQGIGVVPERPPLRWEVWQGEGWAEVTKHSDTTAGLNRDGSIVLLVPGAHEPSLLGATRAYWLRACLVEPERGQPPYQASPQVRRLRVASLGGTVEAEHSEHARREVLGLAKIGPGQVMTLRNRPVLPRDTETEHIEVVAGGVTTVWTEVDDFSASGPDDRHVVWDATTGTIRFGPAISYPDGTRRQHGAIPPEGGQVIVTAYRFGGGAIGNLPARTLTALRTTIPYVARVENLQPATGGVDAETVDNAKARAPHWLRAGERAVTVTDFEQLARAADPAVARARCLAPQRTGDPIRLLLVPDVKRPPEELRLDDFALPEAMVARVTEQLDDRRILGTRIEVGTPYYQGVTIAVLVTGRPGRDPAVVRDRVVSALYRHLSPLTGGSQGRGWGFEADLNAASIVQLVEPIEGVERIDEVMFFEYDLRNGVRKGAGREVVRLAVDSLFLSANHQVVVR